MVIYQPLKILYCATSLLLVHSLHMSRVFHKAGRHFAKASKSCVLGEWLWRDASREGWDFVSWIQNNSRLRLPILTPPLKN